jgi:hypothetical protein
LQIIPIMSGVAPRVQAMDSIPFTENNPSDSTTGTGTPTFTTYRGLSVVSTRSNILSRRPRSRWKYPTVKGAAMLRLYESLMG